MTYFDIKLVLPDDSDLERVNAAMQDIRAIINCYIRNIPQKNKIRYVDGGSLDVKVTKETK